MITTYKVAERNRTAVKQDHNLSLVTSTGSGHSGRRGIRTLKARRPRGLANRPGEPYPAAFRECVGTELNRHSPKASGLQPLELTNAQPTQSSCFNDWETQRDQRDEHGQKGRTRHVAESHKPRGSVNQSALRESNPPVLLGRLAPLPLGQGHINVERLSSAVSKTPHTAARIETDRQAIIT